MADPLSELPQDTGYLPAHSHVVLIGVAGSHENSARMTRAIYNALANRGYIMTRRTHHYSHNVQADASRASRHSRRRIRSWLYATSLLSQRKRYWSRLLFAYIRDDESLVHLPLHNAYAAFSTRTYALAFALRGFRDIDAPHTAGRQAGRSSAATGLDGQVPSRPGRPPSRSRCHHASRTPLSGCGAQPQGAESSTHSKHKMSESYFLDVPGRRGASAMPGELTPTRSRARVAGPGLWPPA